MNEFYTPLDESTLEGFTRRRSQFRQTQLDSATALWADLLEGKVPLYYLQEALSPRTPSLTRAIMSNYPGIVRVQEAMTTSDFPLLTGDVLDRMLLGRYREFPSPWRQFMRVNNNLRDFRDVRRIAADGLESPWSVVEEQEEISYGAMGESGYLYAPKKYARGARISFENLMNDDLGAFESIPDRLGRGGARTVARFATGLYVDANGPHASLYTGGNGNIITSNPPLSVAGLQAGFTQLRGMKDTEGEPIMVESVVLVVPTALEVTARNILNTVLLDINEVGGTTNQRARVDNWMVAGMSLSVDPYYDTIAASSNGNTSWHLFAAPSVGRPALEVGFLRGFGEPQLYQKLANTARVGGGIDQMAGDFATMAQEYKGVIAFGGTRLDPRATVASNGSGN